MKVKLFLVCLVAAALITMGLRVSSVEASQYLGEVTWTGHDDQEGVDFTVKAGISKMGGTYYEVVGQVPSAPGGGMAVFSGGGVLVSGTIVATVTMTNVNSYGKQALVMRLSIDQATFNGSFWLVEPIYQIPHNDPSLNSYSDPFPQGTYPPGHILKSSLYSLGNAPTTGTLTLSGQKPNLTPSISSQLPLLLE
ncbi:MAG: hypothetical protein AB1424_08015 [Thermodesulfobacteriota bacterium]